MFLLAPAVNAEESAEFTETVPKEFSELVSTLPEEIASLLPHQLFSDQSAILHSAVQEMTGFSYLFKTVFSSVGMLLPDGIKLLASTLGLLLLSSVFSALRTSIKSDTIGKSFSFASSLAILSCILVSGYACIESVADYFEKLSNFSLGTIPLLAVLYSMGGNVTAAAASSAGLTIYISIMENVVGRSIVPFCGACLAFGWMSASGLGPGIRSLLATFKKHYATLLAFLMMLLLAMLATQSALSASADTLAMRGIRFATGNLIPIVGGSVSELLRTVSAGIQYLRTTLGISAILLLLFLLLPTLIQLFLYRSVWQISAGFAELLGCDREKILLDEIASLSGYLIAAVSICSSVLFVSFTLLTRCASAIG